MTHEEMITAAHDELMKALPESFGEPETPDTIVPVVTGDTIVELTSWYERHNLCEYGASSWHGGDITDDCRESIELYRVHPESRVCN